METHADLRNRFLQARPNLSLLNRTSATLTKPSRRPLTMQYPRSLFRPEAVRHYFTSAHLTPELHFQNRSKWSAWILAMGIITGAALIPIPRHTIVQGQIQDPKRQILRAPFDGHVTHLHAGEAKHFRSGDLLAVVERERSTGLRQRFEAISRSLDMIDTQLLELKESAHLTIRNHQATAESLTQSIAQIKPRLDNFIQLSEQYEAPIQALEKAKGSGLITPLEYIARYERAHQVRDRRAALHTTMIELKAQITALPFQTKERLARFRQQQRSLQADRIELKRQLSETLASLRYAITVDHSSLVTAVHVGEREAVSEGQPLITISPTPLTLSASFIVPTSLLNGVSLESELQLSRASHDAEVIEWISARVVRIEHSIPRSASALHAGPQTEPSGRITLEWDDTQAIAGAPLLPGERVAAGIPHPHFTAVQWLKNTWADWVRHWY